MDKSVRSVTVRSPLNPGVPEEIPLRSTVRSDFSDPIARAIPLLILEAPRAKILKLVLLSIWTLCDPVTGSTPETYSIEDLGSMWGMSPRDVATSIRELRSFGLVHMACGCVRLPSRSTRCTFTVGLVEWRDGLVRDGESGRDTDCTDVGTSASPVTESLRVRDRIVDFPVDETEASEGASLDSPDVDVDEYAVFRSVCREAAAAVGIEAVAYLMADPAVMSDESWSSYNGVWARYFRTIGREQPSRLDFLAEVGLTDAYVPSGRDDAVQSVDQDAATAVLMDALNGYLPEDFDDGCDDARALSQRIAPSPRTADEAIAAMDDEDDPETTMAVCALDPGRG